MDQIPKELLALKYHSIHVGAFTNESGKLKKFVGRPTDAQISGADHYNCKKVYVPYLYKDMPTNGINIDCRGFTTIDVDEPANCDELERLLEYCTFIIQTHRGYHFYFKKALALENFRNAHLEIIDLNKSNLFFVPTYIHHETGEMFHYKLIKAGPLVEMPEWAISYCRNLISFKKSLKAKTPTVPKLPETIISSTHTTSLLSLEQFEVVLKMYYDNGDLGDYGKWSKAGYALKHLNNSPEAFELFGKYCRMVPKYADVGHDDILKGFTRKYDTNFDPAGVFLKCRSINRLVFNSKLRRVMNKITKYQPEIIDVQYLWDRADIFHSWMENKAHKVLGIHSSYGTGKTVALMRIVEHYFIGKTILPPVAPGQQQIVVAKDSMTFAKPKTARPRVLCINYRKSNTQAQAQDLAKLGFSNYLEVHKEEWDNQDMFIIQLDSLKHLTPSRPYDFLVMDEIEGTLAHFGYEKLDQTVVHSRLIEFIAKANKVLLLDGDIGMRTFDFVCSLPNSPQFKFYRNMHRPNTKHFVVWARNDLEEYLQTIENDLVAGENIVLICMDRGDSSLYYERFKDRYKTILHNSKERNAHLLKDVGVEWRNCRLLIYSPTLESGIDFSVKGHFTKLYGMISLGSTSPRGFCQMMSRVRHFKNDIINLYNSMPTFAANDILITFKEVRDSLYKFVPEVNNLVEILIHNAVESQNSQDHFCTVLADLIEEKEHTYELRKAVLKKAPCKEAKKALELAAIVGARDIDELEYGTLEQQVKMNMELTKADNYAMLKYIYKSRFNLGSIDGVQDMDDFYGKLGPLINWRKLTKTNPLEPEITKYLRHIDYQTTESMRKLIDVLGYEIKNRLIDSKRKKTNWMSEVKEEAMFMLNQKEVMLQLGSTNFVSDRTFHKTLEAYLGQYGYKLTIGERKDRSAAGVRFKDYAYEITEINAIGHLLDSVSKQQLENMECQID